MPISQTFPKVSTDACLIKIKFVVSVLYLDNMWWFNGKLCQIVSIGVEMWY